ncbi:MAG: class I SAM-dependent methyltransferase [Anaerolineae bacterium]|jgi:ubiquinone/menaquinone biosynthesis C-methylase UbiE
MIAGIVIGIVLILLAAALYLEIYFYEGVHLSPRIQGWLYDRWAASYDQEKAESQRHDQEFLVRPLLTRLAQLEGGVPAPLVLDLATGTGRLPLALLQAPEFKGHIIGLDISRGMLAQAAEKLEAHADRVTLLRHQKVSLPFPDDTFDVVACLEALEVMPDMEGPLRELARVLRPGGLLLTSRGRESSGRIGQVRSAEAFSALLQETGFEGVEIIDWWKTFDRVWARKPGRFQPQGPRTLADVLCCPECGRIAWETGTSRFRCPACRAELPISEEGIVLG